MAVGRPKKNNEILNGNFSKNNKINSEEEKRNSDNNKQLDITKSSASHKIKNNELVKEKEDCNVYFSFFPGLKDQVFEIFNCCLDKEKKILIDLKNKALNLVNKELDLIVMISKFIQHESILNSLESDGNIDKFYRFRNLNNSDRFLEKY